MSLGKLVIAVLLVAPWMQIDSSAGEVRPAVDPSPVFEIRWGELRGFIRATGHHHGLIFTEGADGEPITKGRMCTLNLEHYSETGKTGPFLPRKESLHSYEREGDVFTLTVDATDEWPLVSRVRYDLSNEEFIEVTFKFEFQRDFPQFEAFVASYMHRWTPPLIKCSGEWVRPFPEKRYQMFVPREDAVAGWPLDGRWGWFTGSLRPKVSSLRYDIPVMVSRDDATEWSLIQMVPPEMISALSPNTFAPAHDLCLVGRDVKAGETVSVPVRLLYRQVPRMEMVEEWYEEFLQDLKH
jgi:hypothetical protein